MLTLLVDVKASGDGTEGTATCGDDTSAAFDFALSMGLGSAECRDVLKDSLAEGLGQTVAGMCAADVASFAQIWASWGLSWTRPAQSAEGTAITDIAPLSVICPTTCKMAGFGMCELATPPMQTADAAILEQAYQALGRATHSALPTPCTFPRCTSDPVHRVWFRRWVAPAALLWPRATRRASSSATRAAP